VSFQDGQPTPDQRTPAWVFQAREGLSRSAIEGGYLFATGTSCGLDLNLSADSRPAEASAAEEPESEAAPAQPEPPSVPFMVLPPPEPPLAKSVQGLGRRTLRGAAA
jgi:hypothetical protein